MALTLASVVLATRADSLHGTLAPVPFGSSYSVQPSFLPGRVCVSSSVSASFLWPRPFALFNAPQTGSDRCRGRTGLELRNMIYTMGTPKASSMQMPSTDGGDGDSDIFEGQQIQNSSRGNSFLAKLAVAIGIAAAMTVASIYFMGSKPGMPFGTSFGFEASSSSVSPASSGFTLTFFGYKVVLPEYTPGWLYFWLLMAAGCGLFISEEALNVWVGISLSRTLYLDGTLKSFMHSFSNNAPYIISTVLWVYWGVCISDMIPFYLGRLFRQTKTCNDICSKLGIGKDKVISISRAVQKYDNMIGFGHFTRVFFCWCLLWWSHYSSNSAWDRILAKRKTNYGPHRHRKCCGLVDCAPIHNCSFCGILCISPQGPVKPVIASSRYTW